jgi:cytochrome c nitrite reductase small subunit
MTGEQKQDSSGGGSSSEPAVTTAPEASKSGSSVRRALRQLSIRGIALAALVGVPLGLGAFTFSYAEGLSYMSEDPSVCRNCHIMNTQFDDWAWGPHHAAATCNDCHLPQTFPSKYIAKGLNGYHHSAGFTLQPARPDAPGADLYYEEPIRIKPSNSQILQDNCLRCHGDLVHEIVRGSTWADDAVRCVHCHSSVGHGARG